MPNTGDVFYGFANGIINVFPAGSLPQYCRGNITTFYNAVNTLFVKWSYVWPSDEIKIVTDIQNLLKFPYGVSFNCYFFIYNIFVAIDNPLEDGVLTPEEALNQSLLIVDDTLTNFLFNLGFIYNDIFMTLTLKETETKYW